MFRDDLIWNSVLRFFNIRIIVWDCINNKLRTKNMIKLLEAMGINLDNTQVLCNDERVVFHSEGEGIKALAENLQALLQTKTQVPVLKQMTVAELILDDITKATCLGDEETQKKRKEYSCAAVFGILQKILNVCLMRSKSILKSRFNLLRVYMPLFSSLVYPHMTIEGDTLKSISKTF